MLRTCITFLAIGVFWWSAVPAAQESSVPAPEWSRTFRKDFWVINTNTSVEYGLRDTDKQMPRNVGSIDSVSTQHSALLILEGDPQDGATLHALDAETGSALWQRSGVRLNRWRPFPTYVPAITVKAYYAEIVGGVVLLWIASGAEETDRSCGTGSRLVALDLRTGVPVWCTRDLPHGDVTFVPLPHRRVLLVWGAADAGVALSAIDLRTGAGLWRLPLDIKGADWQRVVSWFTALTAREGARPPLEHNGLIPVIASGAKRFGPILRGPNETAIQMVDLASGKRLWQVTAELEGSKPWLSWTFTDDAMVTSTGKVVSAYDLASAKRRWSTPLDDVRSLRVIRTPAREVVLMDFDTRTFQGRPTSWGRGLAAIDMETGKLLWHERDVRALHPLELTAATILVRHDRDVIAKDVVSGAEARRLRHSFEDDVLNARLLPPNRVALQSATEVAIFEGGATVPAFEQRVPRALRGIGRAIVFGILTPPIQGAVLVAEWISPGAGGLRSTQIRAAQQSAHAFFATGRGSDSQLIAVDLDTQTTRAVSPYIWPDRSGFSLGNLLNDAHGFVYTMSDKTFTAYTLQVDKAAHEQVHRLAELQRAVELRDRSAALATQERRDEARRDALAAIATVDRRSDWALEPSVHLLVLTTTGDCHALLANMTIDSARATHASSGITAYETALALIAQTSTLDDKTTVAELEAQVTRLRRFAPLH